MTEAGAVPRVTRVAAYALCTEYDAILLCRIAPGSTSNDDGSWTLPGGGLDFGEQPAAAALRELRDEPHGSTDTCRWVPRRELGTLPIVDLVEVGARLAFGDAPHQST